MAINKIVYNGGTLIDLTGDTVTSASLMQGYTAHDRSGEIIIGTATGGFTIITDEEGEHGDTIRHITTGETVEGSTTLSSNGTHDVAHYATAVVNVVPTLQSKSVTPSETAQTVSPDGGYDGLSQVNVGAISSTYVGSGITQRSSSDLSASGSTVTAPAGYYSAQASKSVATATQATPSVSVNSSTGLVTATATQTAGYVSAGSKSGTLQLTTQAAKTVTPSTSSQTAVAAGRFTTGAVTVEAMPSGTAGTPTATKGAVSSNSVTVTPSVTNTTGYITGGTQTGTGVTVSASELVSGTKSITANGTGIDVTNYASVDVNVSGVVLHTATISSTGNSSYCYVRHNNTTTYYTSGDTFLFAEGDSLYCYVKYSGGMGNVITLNGSTVAGGTGSTSASYTYTMPAKDIRIGLTYSAQAQIRIVESVIPTAYATAQTVTPNAAGITLSVTGRYFTGNITVNGDANLVAENIKEGVVIFGVTGTYSGE